MHSNSNKILLSFISLGCPKNTVDSEKTLNFLAELNFNIVADPVKSDVVIVNTCGFIEPAVNETIDVLNEMINLKKKKRNLIIIAMGCAVSREEPVLQDVLKQIDGSFPLGREKELIAFLKEKFKNIVVNANIDKSHKRTLSITLPHYAYLKIADGCSRNCTFCTIPSIKGKYISRPMDEIIDEANSLSKRGVKELIIIAQDTTNYGMDLYNTPKLLDLLKELIKIDEIKWIRLMYAYPENVTQELLDFILANPKFVKYIDMPIQHTHSDILTKMGRKNTFQLYDEIFSYLRKKNPDFCIRTSVITGFPGETDEHFSHLMNYIGKVKFDRLGVFKFCREKGAPAYKLDEIIPESTINTRHEQLMLCQQEIHFKKNEELVGKTLNVIIDQKIGKNKFIGRTERDAPEIDSHIIVNSHHKKIESGNILQIKVKNYFDYDLEGTL
ncbi:MAG: hypothetical protein ACD_79C01058G0002 [uncultured bacterium]|nr:MAG: hypothetical protein ACD_79C01058G0002 [uncultured bacterium]